MAGLHFFAGIPAVSGGYPSIQTKDKFPITTVGKDEVLERFPITNVGNDGMGNIFSGLNVVNKGARLVSEREKEHEGLALSFWLPVQADIQNALDKCLIGHACAFSRLCQILPIG